MRRKKPGGAVGAVGKEIRAVDLFCGVGGLTRGLEKAGIDVRLGVDIDPACEFAYTANNEADFLLESVNDLKSMVIESAFGKNSIRLLAGCAPCQTFSSYYQKASQADKRWGLLMEFSRLVKQVKPELVTMENVPGLRDHEVFQRFLGDLTSRSCKYEVWCDVVDCSDYGVPQSRQRLVLLASRLGPIELLKPERFKKRNITVRNAIGSLPPLRAGEVLKRDPLHQASSLSDLNFQRIQASKPGGTWRDWDEDLVAKCHRKATGRTYPGVYGRMSWDQPAPTITTQYYGFGNGRFGHPEQDRAISLREGAILQSFPRKYKFVQKGEVISKTVVGRLIGNAVPVRIGEVIGRSIKKHVTKLDNRNMREVSR